MAVLIVQDLVSRKWISEGYLRRGFEADPQISSIATKRAA